MTNSYPVADPGGGGQSGHGPIQSDSLAINFEFDIRPRGVRPYIRCFFVFGQLTLRQISKIGVTADVRF